MASKEIKVGELLANSVEDHFFTQQRWVITLASNQTGLSTG